MGQELSSAEETIKAIRRNTRRKYSTEEKVRIMMKVRAGRRPSQNCAGERASHRAFTASGANSS
jgi:hypothetical protein